MNNRGINHKTLFSKWLLAVVLLLGFFTFSAVAVTSQAKQNSSQTEATYTAQTQAVKSISYKRALKPAQIHSQSFSIVPAIDLARFHGLMTKTRINSCYDKIINRLQSTPHYQRKLIPQNKSDEPAIA